MPIPKLENEPRLMGLGLPAPLVEWCRRATRAVNALIDAVGDVRAGATPISAVLDAPAFSAYCSAAATLTASTNTVLPCNIEEFDTNNCYNTSNYRFTPNVAGYYQFNAQVLTTTPSNSLAIANLFKNSAQLKRGNFSLLNTAAPNLGSVVSALIYLNGTTDYVDFRAYVATTCNSYVAEGAFDCYFQGFLARRA